MASLSGCDGATATGSGSPPPAATPTPTPVASAACTYRTVETLGQADVPQNLCVPAMATDEKSTLLVWNKPDQYAQVIDYNVYQDGNPIGTAELDGATASPARKYVDAFYAADTAKFHARARSHNFVVSGLAANTTYSFTVRAVYSDGHLSAPSAPVVVKTTAAPTVIDVTSGKYGAKGDGTTLNTAAIQAAIDDCPAGCKVLIPSGTFKSGALFLKSNMTLEIAAGGTLLGSEKAEDYPLAKGYVLYSYTDQNAAANKRPPSLLNAIDPVNRAAGTFQNIRIVGKGVVDGNGWKKTTAGQITDEVGNSLPQYMAGSSGNVGTAGILAGDQVAKARAADPTLSLSDAYSNRRSSLVTLRGVRNLYIGGITIRNPAYHGIMNLENENVAINAVVHQTFGVNNGDGIEFGNSKNVMVVNSFFDTGDDCVNFAAGQGVAAAALPSGSGAWIFNNYYREGHGAVVLGSHTGAFIENILAEDNVMFHTDVDLRMKSTPPTGGGGRFVIFRDNAARDASDNPFVFTLSYSAGATGFAVAPTSAPALFSNITVRNVTVDQTGFTARPAIALDGIKPGNADGYVETWHHDINFYNVKLKALRPVAIDHLRDSVFNNVEVISPTATPFWVITASPNVTLTGTTTLP